MDEDEFIVVYGCRQKTSKKRLANIMDGLLWAVKQRAGDVSSEELRLLLGTALRRNRDRIIADVMAVIS